jgi:hypothetical protein
LRHRPPRHHTGSGHGDRATTPARGVVTAPWACACSAASMGQPSHLAAGPSRGPISAQALFIGFQFLKSFFLLKFPKKSFKFLKFIENKIKLRKMQSNFL